MAVTDGEYGLQQFTTARSGRPPTARSSCRSRRRPTGRRARWTGGCFCPDHAMAPPSAVSGRVPEDGHPRPKWQLALDILDELIRWGPPRRVVQADGGYSDITAFGSVLISANSYTSCRSRPRHRRGPQTRDRSPATTTGVTAGPVARHPDPPSNLRDLALVAGADRSRLVGWREGDRGPLRSRFVPHHPLACVTVAHAFLTTCRLQRAGPDAVRPRTAGA
jgi:DDE superfamily endonuclease